MRLFFATPADPETKDEALAAIARLRTGPGEYRWSAREDLHTTLRFVGETSETERPALEALLRRVAAETPPFDVLYGAIGAFDSFDDPRVIWLGLREGTDALGRLATALGRDEPRPFRAHLTLGYRRGDRSPASVGPFLRAQPASTLRRTVRTVALFESAPRRVEPAYRMLLEAPLQGEAL
ncbi:MAG: RNA 2',3'-cyclic phosphodiesterase [Myxococcota bacterium]